MATASEPKATATPDSNAVRSAAIVIIIVMSITALKLGRAVVLPVVVAVLLMLLLSTPVRWLRRHRIPEKWGAAIVVFGALGIALTIGGLLIGPATNGISAAPAAIAKVSGKIRHIMQPISALQQSAEKIGTVTNSAAPAGTKTPAQVQIAGPGIFETVGKRMLDAVPATLSVIFLTYFLLASGPLFRRKIAQILPGRRDVQHFENIMSEIELVTSKFLTTATMINSVVGILTGLALWAAGVSSPILWGCLAAVLNFVPYIGPITTFFVIAFASFASVDDSPRVFVAPGCFLLIHLTENNLVTPMLLGRRLPVNTVAIFLGLIFFGWVWGIPGAVLAVPLTTVVKIACDHVPALHHFGELLGN